LSFKRELNGITSSTIWTDCFVLLVLQQCQRKQNVTSCFMQVRCDA